MAATRKSGKIRIRRVIDGDSLEVKYAGLFSFLRRPFQVRLYAIDAPELAQPFGPEARDQLASLVRGRGAMLQEVAKDRYGRTVGLVYPGSRRRECVNVAMVRSGMAWWYRRYGGRDLGFPEAEAEAKIRRRGVWRDGQRSQRPWDYRADIRRASQKRRRVQRVCRLSAWSVAVIVLAILIALLMLLDALPA